MTIYIRSHPGIQQVMSTDSHRREQVTTLFVLMILTTVTDYQLCISAPNWIRISADDALGAYVYLLMFQVNRGAEVEP